jgi:hypothetical protein
MSFVGSDTVSTVVGTRIVQKGSGYNKTFRFASNRDAWAYATKQFHVSKSRIDAALGGGTAAAVPVAAQSDAMDCSIDCETLTEFGTDPSALVTATGDAIYDGGQTLDGLSLARVEQLESINVGSHTQVGDVLSYSDDTTDSGAGKIQIVITESMAGTVQGDATAKFVNADQPDVSANGLSGTLFQDNQLVATDGHTYLVLTTTWSPSIDEWSKILSGLEPTK